MSEYQYFEFKRVDGRLTPDEQQELRGISSRARINSRSFCNHYNYGDLSAKPLKILAKYHHWPLVVYDIEKGSGKGYDKATKLLVDLRSAYQLNGVEAHFYVKLNELMASQKRRPSLILRLQRRQLIH